MCREQNLKGNFPSCLVSKMTDFKGVTTCDRPIPIPKPKLFNLKGVATKTVFKNVVQEENDAVRAIFLFLSMAMK
jgi:hypothetical protein